MRTPKAAADAISRRRDILNADISNLRSDENVAERLAHRLSARAPFATILNSFGVEYAGSGPRSAPFPVGFSNAGLHKARIPRRDDAVHGRRRKEPHRGAKRQPRGARWRGGVADRSERLRQIHASQHRIGPHRAERGRGAMSPASASPDRMPMWRSCSRRTCCCPGAASPRT